MNSTPLDRSHQIRISKYLSKHLRHTPERIGLTLAPGGWVQVNDLLHACARDRFPISRAELEQVVLTSDKQRFAFDESGQRIRANQGHSTNVDLLLEPAVPPDVLYHGTGHRAVETILQQGLHKMSRHHVHLSGEIETARRVGMRHGQPAVFQVDAIAMSNTGFLFFCSENGVWLVDHVPVAYLTLL